MQPGKHRRRGERPKSRNVTIGKGAKDTKEGKRVPVEVSRSRQAGGPRDRAILRGVESGSGRAACAALSPLNKGGKRKGYKGGKGGY